MKKLGAIYGVAIGDALGAPHEFTRAKPKLEYTGILADEDVFVRFRFATMKIPASSVTDDTEMMIQLLTSILETGRYSEDAAIINYLAWANLKETPLGKNTRALMKGVKGSERDRLK